MSIEHKDKFNLDSDILTVDGHYQKNIKNILGPQVRFHHAIIIKKHWVTRESVEVIGRLYTDLKEAETVRQKMAADLRFEDRPQLGTKDTFLANTIITDLDKLPGEKQYRFYKRKGSKKHHYDDHDECSKKRA